MKKILKLILCVLPFMVFMSTVRAREEVYIYLGDEIPNVRLHLKTPTVEKNKKMYEIWNRNTGKLVYCVEPGVVLKNGYFEGYPDLDQLALNFDDEDWNYMRTIAYYGYGYPGREDIKWYAITQFMIWEYLLEGVGEIYFIDTNNQKIDLYQSEMALIKEDLAHHLDIPSFFQGQTVLNYQVDLTNEFTFKDEYGILEEFSISTNNPNAKINGDEFSISFDHPGDYQVVFSRDTSLAETPKIYYSPNSQTVMNRGIIDIAVSVLNFRVNAPSFKLIKESQEESHLTLQGAKYGIYYENGELYTTLTTDEEGVAYLDEINLGKYYLQEIEAPYGYKLNNEKIYFEVVDEDVILRVKDSLIKKEILIEKYLEKIHGELELEKDATFQILFQDTMEVIGTLKTDQYGQCSILLPYGNYILRQITSKEGYALATDILLTVNEETRDLSIHKILNPEIWGSLVVLKKDLDTDTPILDEAEFRIKNVDTGEYLSLENKSVFKTVDAKLQLDYIPYGNYELIEVKAPNDYIISEENYFFQINEKGQVITIEVLNKLQNGSLIIEKIDDKTMDPLEGVLFGLYDQDQNLLQEYYTDLNGRIQIDSLLEGLYYIKELNTLPGYELLDGFLDVAIKNNTISTIKVTNRLKIDVPKTGVDEFMRIFLVAIFCLTLGVIIYKHEQNV